MPYDELHEHVHYLGDAVKLTAFRRALEAAFAVPGRTLLDLGAGTGILGLLGARAGARHVYAVEDESIIGPAREVAIRCGFGDAITHVQKLSTDVELPERVDVAVCDQMGGMAYDAGILEYFADARKRLMKPDGVLVPRAFRLFLAPAECTEIRDHLDLWGSSPAGFDFSVFRDHALNTEFHVEADKVRVLGTPVHIADVESDHSGRIEGSGTSTIETAGHCDGLVGWFEADMGGGASLTNDPRSTERLRRWCNFYPVNQRTPSGVGEAVTITMDIRPLGYTATWTVAMGVAGEPAERHSTFLGDFLSPKDIARTRDESQSDSVSS